MEIGVPPNSTFLGYNCGSMITVWVAWFHTLSTSFSKVGNERSYRQFQSAILNCLGRKQALKNPSGLPIRDREAHSTKLIQHRVLQLASGSQATLYLTV